MKKLFALLLLVALPGFAADTAAEPTKVAFQVVTDNDALKQMLDKGLNERFAANETLEISEKVYWSKLIIYAVQTSESKSNPDGWIFSVAHVSNYPAMIMASNILGNEDPAFQKQVADLKPVVEYMANEPGLLSHLNVAHLDSASQKNIDTLLDTLFTTFLNKLK